MDKFVSVIIPVLNNIRGLRQTLAALESQTYPKELYEVIVVDNGSKENLAEVVREYDRTKLAYEPQPGSYVARNRGIRIARGEVLAFTDSDCIPKPDWLTNGVRQLTSTDNCGLVAGKVEFFYQDPSQPTSVELYDSVTFLDQEKYVREHQYGATANMFTWKQVMDAVGEFNASLKSGGDKEWGKRVARSGYDLVYGENASIAHPARHSLKEISQKIARTRMGGYEADLSSAENKFSFLWHQLVDILWRLKPPTRTAVEKFQALTYPLNRLQKIKLLALIWLIHYQGAWIDIKTYFKNFKYIFS